MSVLHIVAAPLNPVHRSERQNAVSIIVPAVNSIAADGRRPILFMKALLSALGDHVRMDVLTLGDVLERRFAKFAGVPYQDPISRQQWEDLWETEAEP